MHTAEAVQAFLASRAASGRKPTTITSYRQKLIPYAEMFPELPQSPEQEETFLARLTCGPMTVHGYWRAVRAMHGWAARRLGLPDPTRLVEPPPKPKVHIPHLSRDEVARMFSACQTQRESAFLVVLFGSGLRLGEVIRLRHEDLRERTIVVRDRKSRDELEVPFSPGLRDLVRGLGQDGWIFVSERTGRPLGPTGAYRLYQRIRERAGIWGDRLTRVHVARHTAAVHLYEASGDVLFVKEVLGHASIQTTMAYVRASREHVLATYALADPLRLIPLRHTLSLALDE